MAALPDRLVGLVGALPYTVHAGPFTYTAAGIGAVCTDPAWRGRGLAGRLLALQWRILASRGVDLAIISGDRSLYRRAGATPAGPAHRFQLTALAHPGLALTPLTAQNIELAARLWAMQPVRIERDPTIWQTAIAGAAFPPSRRFASLVGDPPRAYVVLDTPAPGTSGLARIFELAGEAAAAVAAARHLAAAAGTGAIEVIAPDWDFALGRELTRHATTSCRVHQPGTYCLPDPLRTFERLQPLLAALDPATATWRLWPEEQGFVLEGPPADRDAVPGPTSGWAESATQVCRLLFGADGAALSPALPVPLPCWQGFNYV